MKQNEISFANKINNFLRVFKRFCGALIHRGSYQLCFLIKFFRFWFRIFSNLWRKRRQKHDIERKWRWRWSERKTKRPTDDHQSETIRNTEISVCSNAKTISTYSRKISARNWTKHACHSSLVSKQAIEREKDETIVCSWWKKSSWSWK